MAPTIAGTNCLTQAEDALIALLAASSACQTFLGAADETEAKARIYSHDIPEPTDRDDWDDAEWQALFPCVIIAPPDGAPLFTVNHSATDADSFGYVASFRFSARLERYFPTSMDSQDGIRDFLNKVGDVIEDIIGSSYTPGQFAFSQLSAADGMYLADYSRRKNLGPVQGFKWDFVREVPA